MRKLVLTVATFGALALSAMLVIATGTALGGDGALPSELQEVRAAVARYHSVEQAQANGYHAEPVCVSSPAGTMGHHAVNPALIADPAIDPLEPEMLLYVPKDNGALQLVGVEYWKADADQNLATAGDRPSLFGQAFQGPMPGHSPAMPIHYDLHVWVAEENPSGVFALFNPELSC